MKRKIFTILFLALCRVAYSQFEIIPTFTNANLTELHFFNHECFILGNQHYLAKCDPDGENLVLKNVPGQTDYWFQYFNRVDTNTAYSVSYFPSFQGGNYEIYKTRDNAGNWELVYSAANGTAGALVMFDSLEGLHDNNNLDNTINRTVDSCVNWQNETGYPYSGLHFFDTYGDSTICVGDVENFSISYDRGHTWMSNYYQQPGPTSFDILSKDTIISTGGSILGTFFLKTYNKGVEWSQKELTPYSLNKVIRFKNDTLFIVGGLGIDVDEFGNIIYKGVIMRTVDFGENWTVFETEIISNFLNIAFTSDSTALISGTNGILFKYNFRDHHLGFKELEPEQNRMTLFPNPTNDIQELRLQSPHPEKLFVKLLDVSGKELKTLFGGQSAEDKITIDLSSFQPGVYFVVLQSGSGTQVLKTQKL